MRLADKQSRYQLATSAAAAAASGAMFTDRVYPPYEQTLDRLLRGEGALVPWRVGGHSGPPPRDPLPLADSTPEVLTHHERTDKTVRKPNQDLKQ